MVHKTKSHVHPLKVTLEELYHGVTRRIAVNRDVLKKNKTLVKEKKVLECVIKPGTPHGKHFKFKHEAD